MLQHQDVIVILEILLSFLVDTYLQLEKRIPCLSFALTSLLVDGERTI